MKHEELLELETKTGVKVKDIELVNGYHLVYKIPISSETIALPSIVQKKSVRNVVMIVGQVVRSSSPFRRKHSKRHIRWKQELKDWKTEWTVRDGTENTNLISKTEIYLLQRVQPGKDRG